MTRAEWFRLLLVFFAAGSAGCGRAPEGLPKGDAQALTAAPPAPGAPTGPDSEKATFLKLCGYSLIVYKGYVFEFDPTGKTGAAVLPDGRYGYAAIGPGWGTSGRPACYFQVKAGAVS